MSSATSIVLSCAGVGSRLGLGKTKALMDMGDGETLIAKQIRMFDTIEDVRVVVGYQAREVVDEVLKYRKDIVFVYNHDYFDTKTGMSFYLGAKDAREYVIEWDGDLLVHPDDAKMLLSLQDEYIAYSDKMSDEAVMVNIDKNGNVISFSRDSGDYEWAAPACIKKYKVCPTNGHVFNMLEPHLPMRGIKIRACDIDTFEDYQRALNLIKGWKNERHHR